MLEKKKKKTVHEGPERLKVFTESQTLLSSVLLPTYTAANCFAGCLSGQLSLLSSLPAWKGMGVIGPRVQISAIEILWYNSYAPSTGNVVVCFKQAGNTAGADPLVANIMQKSQLQLQPTVYSTSCGSIPWVP